MVTCYRGTFLHTILLHLNKEDDGHGSHCCLLVIESMRDAAFSQVENIKSSVLGYWVRVGNYRDDELVQPYRLSFMGCR